MTKGRLTTNEKYIIQGMKHEGKSVEDIASQLGRTEKSVQKYLDGELDKLHSQVAINKMNEGQPPQAKKYTAKDLMVTSTEEGKKGTVVIMTEAASMKSDKAKETYQGRVNRVFDKNIVRISDNKTLERGDLINEQKSGPLSEDEMRLLVNMVKQNKSVKHIALNLNRHENDIAKVVNGL